MFKKTSNICLSYNYTLRLSLYFTLFWFSYSLNELIFYPNISVCMPRKRKNQIKIYDSLFLGCKYN